jgi:hypothetical protein
LVIVIRYFGSKQSIIIGLSFQVAQLAAYAFCSQPWLIWFSGLLAAVSSIGYPAISAYISNHSHSDQQGVSQGMVTGILCLPSFLTFLLQSNFIPNQGIRGLCNGIGPAMFGIIFWLFKVNLNENQASSSSDPNNPKPSYASTHFLPGPPFLFGSILALSAIFVTWLIPSNYKPQSILLTSSTSSSASSNPSSSNSSTKQNKDSTIVKLGNSSISYNRNSSTSSLTTPLISNRLNESNLSNSNTNTVKNNINNNINALMFDTDEMIVSDLITYKNLQEKEGLLGSSSSNNNNDDENFEENNLNDNLLLLSPVINYNSNSLSNTTSPSMNNNSMGILNPSFQSGSTLNLTNITNNNNPTKQSLAANLSNLGIAQAASSLLQAPNIKFKTNVD